MSGLFAEWQPRYAIYGIATFPVRGKRPAVRGYLKIGERVSHQLAVKFASDDTFGLACKRNRITVLDVDTPDDRVLADALSRYGDTPFVVRSGSGNFQAWYRHNGERRMVRPDPRAPIDILGDGFVVAPPSQGSKSRYEIIAGKLDDLDRLPVMRASEPPAETAAAPTTPFASMRDGDGRNEALFRGALGFARNAATEEELIKMVAHANQQFAERLPTGDVQRITKSAWRYKRKGRLMIPGAEPTAVMFSSDVANLSDSPNALVLLIHLRLAHAWRGGEPFALARAMARALGWPMPRFLCARQTLIDRGFLDVVHPGGKGPNDPPMARLTRASG